MVFFKAVVLAPATLHHILSYKELMTVIKREISGLLTLKILKHFAASSTIASPSSLEEILLWFSS